MTELALQRLKAAGWTSGRKADISQIEEAYAEAGMQIPDKLREFFEEFGFLRLTFDIRHTEPERHTPDTRRLFLNYPNAASLADLFADYGIFGTAYPVGFAFRGNMELFFHDDGNFYLYMPCCQLVRERKSGADLVAALCGDEAAKSAWERLAY